MSKIEQIWNILCKRQRELVDAIVTNKEWTKTMNVNHEIGKLDKTELYLTTQLNEVNTIISQYRFIYSDELDVIIGNCMEFKVR